MAQFSREEKFAQIRKLVQDGRDRSQPGSKAHSVLLEIDNIVLSLADEPKEVLANINPPTIALQITTGGSEADQITYRLEVPPQDTMNDFETLIELSKLIVFIHNGDEETKS